MGVIHADILKDPFIFNSDRNTWMSGGGTHSWTVPYHWITTAPIYINWLAGRSTGSATRRGSASYNQVAAFDQFIDVDQVAYVDLQPQTDGATLGLTVCAGTALPQGDNIYVLAMHRNIGLTPNNPLLLRWGNSITIGGNYSASAVVTLGYANNYTGATWTVNHNLGLTDVLVQCLDNSSPRNVIYPGNIEITDANNVTVTWSSSVTGRAVVMKISS